MSEFHLNIGPLKVALPPEKLLSDNCTFRCNIFYQKKTRSLLNALCDKYGSDKGEIVPTGHPYPWPAHPFADYYEGLFGHCHEHIRTVFECGLGSNNPDFASNMGQLGKSGASLRVWREYFPNAHIFGADIDTDTLFQDERISTFFVDQTSPESIAHLWQAIGPQTFDQMIDDGLHVFEAGICLFENSFSRLRDSGIYIIEDVHTRTMLSYRTYFDDKDYDVEFITMNRPAPFGNNDSLVVVRK